MSLRERLDALPALTPPPRSLEWLHPLAVVLLLLPLYAWTSPRGVALEDDGLFAMSAYFLGIPQPPGYPLHTLLAKLFTFLPIGSVAYRVHLLSGVFGALTCAMVWLILRALACDRIAAYAGALLLGLSGTFWSQAIIGEVYSLNTFLFFTLIYLALVFLHGRRRAVLYAASAVLGFGLADHWPLMVLSLPAVGIVLYPVRREVFRHVGVAAAIAVAAAGLPYLWLVIRSHAQPAVSFYGPISSVSEFLFFLARRGFREVDVSQSATAADKLQFLGLLGSQMAREYTLPGILLVAAGLAQSWRRLGLILSGALVWAWVASSLLLTLLLSFDFDPVMRTVIRVYPLIPFGVMAIWVGLGLGLPWFGGNRVRAGAKALVAMALLIATFLSNVGVNDRHAYTWAGDYARAVLRELAPNAILFVHGDQDALPIGYTHLVEGVRPDVTLYNDQGLLFSNRLSTPFDPERARKIAALIRETERPVYHVERIDHGISTTDGALYVKPRTDLPPGRLTFELTDTAREFLGRMETATLTDAWSIHHREVLRRRFMEVLAYFRIHEPAVFARAGLQAPYEQMEKSPYGQLGLLTSYNLSAMPPADALEIVDRVDTALGGDASKADRARPPYMRGLQFFRLSRDAEAADSLRRSVEIYPNRKNPAVMRLLEYYAERGVRQAFFDLGNRFYLGRSVDRQTQEKLVRLGARVQSLPADGLRPFLLQTR